jgi:molybdate transport system ATP-binding protein
VLRLGANGTGARLLAHVTQRSWDQLKLAEEMPVYGLVKGVALLRAQSAPPWPCFD